ncbi:MAG: helix-turn-helix transcriptional regulator [Desulfobacterales bacterium]
MKINQTTFYLTDKQVAQRYGVHRTTIWRWVRAGSFPAPKAISEGCKRWSDNDIAAHEQRVGGRESDR